MQMEKKLMIMMSTTVFLSTHQTTTQTSRSASDLVEFYAGASLPCRKIEFKKGSRLILQCAPDELSAWRLTLKERLHECRYLDGAFCAFGKAGSAGE
jgi:hypothetical protein